MITAEQFGQWISDGAGWAIWASAWLLGVVGALCGIVTVVVTLTVCVMMSIDAHRERHERRRVAYRDWCDRTGWCPIHNRPNGQCPRIESARTRNRSPFFVECIGSEGPR